MGLFSSLTGRVTVELTSADVANTLRSINSLGIPISDVRPEGDLTVFFTAPRRGMKQIERLITKRGARLKVLSRKGVFWSIVGLKNRLLLLIGIVSLLILSLFVPTRVLLVEVEGNESIPNRLILEAAQNAGICFGASRRDVRSERMKNALLSVVPQLQWAGVNTYGCKAVISVRERTEEQQNDKNYVFSNIVAACDGIITSCTVTSGTALSGVGQAVRKGQVLISGYTDCGLAVAVSRASGEVFAETRHAVTVVMPSEVQIRGERTSDNINYALLLGKKRINFYKGSGISDGSCVKMYWKYDLTLPGGFRLPVSLIKEEVTSYEMQARQGNEAEAKNKLTLFAKDYLRNHMVAGTVTSANEELYADDGLWRMNGTYACVEMIGREQREQIGEFHGKTD